MIRKGETTVIDNELRTFRIMIEKKVELDKCKFLENQTREKKKRYKTSLLATVNAKYLKHVIEN
jgi:hypothetical protein